MSRPAASVAAVLVALALAGCAGDGPSPSTTTETTSSYGQPGDPAVYAEIEAMTSCVRLQEKFDIAMDNTDIQQDLGNAQMANITLSYADAADMRMRAIGCYS